MIPPDSATSANGFAARSKVFSRLAGAFGALVGASALAGWLLDVQSLKSVYGDITMKANAALSLLLAGFSLCLLNSGRGGKAARRAGQVCAALAALVGVLTLSQHIFGWELGVDQLLFAEGPGAPGTASPGRMGLNASSCFTLSGIALLLLHARRGVSLAHLLATAVSLLAFLAITGYVYRAEELYGIARYTGIALHTAVSLFALGLGLLAARPGEGITSVISSERAGGVMARRLLPVAVAVPFLLGWLRVIGQRAGYYDLGLGTALWTLAVIVIFTAAVWLSAARLNQLERQRLEAEAGERAAQSQLTDVLGRTADGFIVLDNDWRCAYVNEQGARMLRKARGELLGVIIWEVFPGAVGSESYGRFIKSKSEQAPDRFEQLYQPFNAWYEVDVYPSPEGVTLFFRDITERKLVETEREKLLAREQAARVEAEAASLAKDEFLATVSHELRTPLTAVIGWAHLLRVGSLDGEAARRAVEIIERNARAQAQLVEDVLDVSRIVSGKLRLAPRLTQPAAPVTAAVEAVRPAAQAKDVALDAAVDPAAGLVMADADRLRQVAWNLLSNAVKFTPPGGRVHVRLVQEDGQVRLSVSDTGQGISPEFLPHVFERFRQQDGSTTREYGGLGLGLAIVRHLVEAHGGTVAAESEGPGRGATFTVRLPRVQAMPTEAEVTKTSGGSPQLQDSQPAAELPALGGLRVLIVDDERDVRELLMTVFAGWGAEAREAVSAEEAFDAVKDWMPDVIISDIGMPGEDGYSLIDRVRRYERGMGRRTPALALTGYARRNDREEALRAGFDAHLPKPVGPNELAAAVAALAGRDSQAPRPAEGRLPSP